MSLLTTTREAAVLDMQLTSLWLAVTRAELPSKEMAFNMEDMLSQVLCGMEMVKEVFVIMEVVMVEEGMNRPISSSHRCPAFSHTHRQQPPLQRPIAHRCRPFRPSRCRSAAVTAEAEDPSNLERSDDLPVAWQDQIRNRQPLRLPSREHQLIRLALDNTSLFGSLSKTTSSGPINPLIPKSAEPTASIDPTLSMRNSTTKGLFSPTLPDFLPAGV